MNGDSQASNADHTDGVAPSDEVIVQSAGFMQPVTNPTDRTYTFTWSYSRDELVRLSSEIDSLHARSRAQTENTRSNQFIKFLFAGALMIMSMVLVNFFDFSFLSMLFTAPMIITGVLLALHATSAAVAPPSKGTKLRHENFADYFMSIFQNAPVTATISAERITVSTETSDRSTRWIGSAGFFTTPSAFLITSSLNEWLLCLPRSVVNPSEEERLAADLKRWYEAGQRKRLLAYLRNAPVSCPKCSYNLKGITELTCPECGTPLEPASILR